MAGIMLVLAHVTARDSAGFYTSATERFTHADLRADLGGHADRRRPRRRRRLGARRARRDRARAGVRARRPARCFIGIAAEADVDRYLTQVAHEEITDVHGGPFSYDSRAPRRQRHARGARQRRASGSPPTSGAGTQALTWKPDGGRWAVVVMNAGGSRGRDGRRQRRREVRRRAARRRSCLLGLGLAGLGVGRALILLAVREERVSPVACRDRASRRGRSARAAPCGAGRRSTRCPAAWRPASSGRASRARSPRRRARRRMRSSAAKTAPELRTALRPRLEPGRAGELRALGGDRLGSLARGGVDVRDRLGDHAARQREQRARRRRLERRPDRHDDRGARAGAAARRARSPRGHARSRRNRRGSGAMRAS